MDKKKRVIVCVVMAILMAITWFLLDREDKKKPEEQNFDSVIDKYESLGKITYVKVSDGERTQALLWDGKFWRWEDRPNLSAPQDELTKSLKKVAEELHPQKVAEELLPEDTGLLNVSYTVLLRDQKGNELAIQIGTTNEIGSYYARLDGSEEIYTIRRYAKKMVDEIIVFRMMIDFDINSSPSYMAPH